MKVKDEELKRLKIAVQDLKDGAVNKEAESLESEFNDIFKDTLTDALAKFVNLTDAMEPEQFGYYIANRHDIYELLLDNTTDDILKYISAILKGDKNDSN